MYVRPANADSEAEDFIYLVASAFVAISPISQHFQFVASGFV